MTAVLWISLETIIEVVSTLSSVVSPGCGPSFQHTIVSTATGNVLITNHGLQILQMAEVKHPIAKIIIASIADFYKITGEDGKTFIILLNELFLKFQGWLCANIGHSLTAHREVSSMSHKLSHDITYLMNELLTPFFTSMNRNCLRPPSSPLPSTDLENLIRGTLKSHVQDHEADHLSFLLVNFVSRWHSSERPTLRSTLNHLIHNQKCLIVEDVGKSLLRSSVMPGLLISREFCTSFNSSNEGKNNVKFILLSSDIDAINDDNHTVEVNIPDEYSKDSASSLIEHKRTRAETFIELMKHLHVSLIITSGRFSALEKSLATQNGIKLVDMVAEEEIALLSLQTDKQIIHDKRDISMHHVGSLESCQQISIGSQVYLNLQSDHLLRTCSLVVSGPSESTSRQIRHLLMDCLQVIRSALISHDDPFYFSSCDIGTSAKELLKEPASSHRQDTATSNTPNRHSEQTEQLSPLTTDCGGVSCEKDTGNEWLYTIPVGGTFELSLHDLIVNYMKSGPATAAGTATLSILSEALFVIAGRDANAHCVTKSHRLNAVSGVEMIRGGVDATISQNSSTYSFANKCHLIVCVLTLFRQLLRLVQHA